MNRLSKTLTEISGAAGRIGGAANQLLLDRLELMALELRETKIRFIQILLLACMGIVLSLFGVFLLVLTVIYALPPEWRLPGLAIATGVCLLGGIVAILLLRGLFKQSLPFSQTVSELKKDAACFSTRN